MTDFREMMKQKMDANNKNRGVVVGTGPEFGRTVWIGGDGKECVRKIMAPSKAHIAKTGIEGGAQGINADADPANKQIAKEAAANTKPFKENAQGEQEFKRRMAQQPKANNPDEAERNVRNVLDEMERKKGDPFKMDTFRHFQESATEFSKTGDASLGDNRNIKGDKGTGEYFKRDPQGNGTYEAYYEHDEKGEHGGPMHSSMIDEVTKEAKKSISQLIDEKNGTGFFKTDGIGDKMDDIDEKPPVSNKNLGDAIDTDGKDIE